MPDTPLGHRGLSREEERSLWLHEAVAAVLRRDPDAVLRQAAANLDLMARVHGVGVVAGVVRRWRELLDGGADDVHEVLVGRAPDHVELRQSSPFAGVLDEQERGRLLEEFRRRLSHADAPR